MKKVIICIFICAVMAVSVNTASAKSTQVDVAWTANTESDIAGYNVYKGLEPGVYDGVVDAGDNTGYTLFLEDGTHYLAVTAYDTGGNEGALSEASELVVTTDAPPGAVMNVKEVSRIVTTINITIFLPVSP